MTERLSGASRCNPAAPVGTHVLRFTTTGAGATGVTLGAPTNSGVAFTLSRGAVPARYGITFTASQLRPNGTTLNIATTRLIPWVNKTTLFVHNRPGMETGRYVAGAAPDVALTSSALLSINRTDVPTPVNKTTAVNLNANEGSLIGVDMPDSQVQHYTVERGNLPAAVGANLCVYSVSSSGCEKFRLNPNSPAADIIYSFPTGKTVTVTVTRTTLTNKGGTYVAVTTAGYRSFRTITWKWLGQTSSTLTFKATYSGDHTFFFMPRELDTGTVNVSVKSN